MVKTIACCPCQIVRDLHISYWQSGANCQVVAARAFTLLGSTFGFSLKNAAALLNCLSCCLAHALSARCFPSFRPDTASIRSCLSLPPGFLNTREAGTCARSRAWSSLYFSLFGSAPGDVCPVTSGACTVLDHLCWVRLSALKKYSVLLHFVSSSWITIRRTSSRLFRCVVFVCANVLSFQPLNPLRRRFVGFANGSPSGSRSKTHSRRPIWKNGSSSAMHLLEDPAPQIRVMSSPRLPSQGVQAKACLWERFVAPLPPLRTRLNVISFIRNSSVPFPNAWSCPFRVMLSCQATTILSPQVRITLLCGPSRDLG